MNPRDAVHRDLKLALDGARMMFAFVVNIISPKEGAT